MNIKQWLEERKMNIKCGVNLNPQETLRLTRILLDEDKDEALAFLKECLKPQLDAGDPGPLSAGL